MTATAEAVIARTAAAEVAPAEIRRVVLASSIGTVFEWYDFFLYATLAPFFAALFFPSGNDTAALLSAFATYAAGFVIRPFGAIVFGRLGDLVGRKYTFLLTVLVMGVSTCAIGLLPTYKTAGLLASALLVMLRLLQGLAVGGEYGGACTYVAEHAADDRRGYVTSWIATTGTIGFFLSLLVIGAFRASLSEAAFKNWGWRLPFLVSLVLLAVSIYMRLKLNESPAFQRMKEAGKGSSSPIRDSFFRYPNNKYVLLALFGCCAGQGVVWYCGQFYALFFLTITLKVDYLMAYTLVGVALILATPSFVLFGWLSDRVGRFKLILAACVLAATTYFPLFRALTHAVNPALERYQLATPITVAASDCRLHVFVLPGTTFTPCDKAKDFLTKAGLSFRSDPAVANEPVVTKIGKVELHGFDAAQYTAALAASGYPAKASPADIDYPAAVGIIVLMVIYVAMGYGPIAAYLVELFPTKIRYTSMSLPYHIGNGWFGGMLPLLATALVAQSGNIYGGLWYPVLVAGGTAILGAIFLRDTDHRVHAE
jgi:MFS family permease